MFFNIEIFSTVFTQKFLNYYETELDKNDCENMKIARKSIKTEIFTTLAFKIILAMSVNINKENAMLIFATRKTSRNINLSIL